MTNPYSMGANPQAYQAMYPTDMNSFPQPQRSSGPSTLGMATLGFVGGGTVGYFKNRYPVNKSGQVSDTFAKSAFENHVNKNFSKDNKNIYKQTKNILAKIDKVKDVEGLKKLLKTNKDIAEACYKNLNCTLDDALNSVTSSNLADTKKSLKEHLSRTNNFNTRQFKNFTEKCWDKEAKKFVKPEGLSDEIFNIIKNTRTNIQWKKALKYGGITAGVLGGLTLGYKLLTAKN